MIPAYAESINSWFLQVKIPEWLKAMAEVVNFPIKLTQPFGFFRVLIVHSE